MPRNIWSQSWFYIVIVGLFAATPWLIGASIKPADWDQLPTFVMAAGDTPVYFRYIDEGRRGGPLMIDGMTTEDHPPVLWQPVWWVLGQLANVFGLSSPNAFAVGRVLGAVLLAWTISWAARRLYQDTHTQSVARWLGFFGAGLGGLLFFVVGPQVLSETRIYDLWVSEGYGWMSALASPHFLVVSSGLIFSFIGIEYQGGRAVRWSVGPALALVTSIHPFHAPTLFIAWILLSALEFIRRTPNLKEKIKRRCLTAVWVAPSYLYYVMTYAEPIVRERAVQNINLTRGWPLILGIAPLLVVALVTMIRKRSTISWPIVTWTVAILVMVFAPLDFQRRLFEPPAVLLGLLIAPQVASWFRGTSWTFLGAAGLVAVMLLSPIAVFGKQLHQFFTDRATITSTLSYIQPTMRDMISIIRRDGGPKPVVLGGQMSGLLVGSHHPIRPYYAHGVETIGALQKKETVFAFYRDWTTDEQLRFVRRENICFILLTPYERNYGAAFPGAGWSGLQLVYRRDDHELYRTGYCDPAGVGIVN